MALSQIIFKCCALCNLVPFAQFEKREKNPWRSLTLRKVTLACNFPKSNNFPSMGVFHVFLIVEIVSNHVKHPKY